MTPPVDAVAKEAEDPFYEGEQVPGRQEPEPAGKEMIVEVAAAEKEGVQTAHGIEEQGGGNTGEGASRDEERQKGGWKRLGDAGTGKSAGTAHPHGSIPAELPGKDVAE